jgi:hypothetical protein
MTKVLLFVALAFILPQLAIAQRKDSLIVKDSSGTITIGNKPDTSRPTKADTVTPKKHSPRKAAIYSAILPGLGQVYNKKYWKVPIVYTAIGIPVGLFFNNKTWYDRTRYALAVASSPNPTQDSLNAVHPQLMPFVEQKAIGSILRNRNEFRKNMDYSILFTLLFWGLNVVDATVDAHLKGFNVSDDLSFRVRPALLPGNVPGVTFAFTLGRSNAKTISSPTQF